MIIGYYILLVTSMPSFAAQYLPHLNVSVVGSQTKKFVNEGDTETSILINIDSNPRPTHIVWIWSNNSDNYELITSHSRITKYKVTNTLDSSKLTIFDLKVYDSGTYYINVSNGIQSEISEVDLIVKGVPVVQCLPEGYYKKDKTFSVSCNITAHKPNISWYYKQCLEYPNCENKEFLPFSGHNKTIDTEDGVYMTNVFSRKATTTMILMCEACNSKGCGNGTHSVLVSDVDSYLSLIGPKSSLVSGDDAHFSCVASRYKFNSTTMRFEDMNNTIYYFEKEVRLNQTVFSLHEDVILKNISTKWSGTYICEAGLIDMYNLENPITEIRSFKLEVQPYSRPRITNYSFYKERKIKKFEGDNLNLQCIAEGNPVPKMSWIKNGQNVNESNEKYGTRRIQLKTKDIPSRHIPITSATIVLSNIKKEDEGVYACLAHTTSKNFNHSKFKEVALVVSTENVGYVLWMWVFAALVSLCTIVIISLLYKQKTLKKDLRRAGFYYFLEGKVTRLNPDLDITEQADLLPYDKKFEFPRNKLDLGQQIGSGAFGVVLKAEADGIIEPGIKTTVAVKMVKQNVDVTHVQALASELKVMIHLGRHANVVNLLGACTRKLKNRELLVIVEYCQFGNLHKHLHQNRRKFINQINPQTGRIDPTITTSLIPTNNGASKSSDGPAYITHHQLYEGLHFNSCDTQMTSLSTPVGEDGYLKCKEPEEWTQNELYRSTDKQPITTQDLLCWSFQIARGMEYLGSRKVLHGDLAARNILLADNNVVKICDFGLSKNMYAYKNNDYFVKGEKRLFPVKWMAIEAICDKHFSIQSDVWSYGIVLWELFSLARTPYPGVDDASELYHKLEEGYRMETPPYATNELYSVIMDCWQANPSIRPSFSQLASKLGDMLEVSVRQHYVGLNDSFIAENSKSFNHQDYVSMLSSPTWTTLDKETGEILNHETIGYLPMNKHKNTDALRNSESPIILNTFSRETDCPLTESDSITNLSATSSNPTGNDVTVAKSICGYCNPTYDNIERPPPNISTLT